ncbi:MAG: bifunctional hydroxymethylpyrimidine kinase/phosphomethylpyrimidine kinase [candidate division Zixibacteria bacterium RBG_16_40_9]|nr:MAG: bifunctional hydroxymethylpyrimidine kinase/phosphomethylpyrimidine kinase [candidate division Zixibacteria bacterium RBG_16_40_9]
MRKVALTIAGSDSGAGAGIQADLKTFASLGVYGTSAITAITAQNTVGVKSVQELPAQMVRDQIEAVFNDFEVEAAKTGMLANSEIIGAVAESLKKFKLKNLVVDPVMVAKSGDKLLKPEAIDDLIIKIFPLALMVTPNLKEAEALTNMKISGIEDMKEAAIRILNLGPKAVVVKGGHLEGKPIDVYYDGSSFQELESPRVLTTNNHGSGCTFSAAICGFLTLGLDLYSAVVSAKEYITQALKASYQVGHGHGPVNQFFEAKIYEAEKVKNETIISG